MTMFFRDNKRTIKVNSTEDAVGFGITGIKDIFPLLHYFEEFPEAREKSVIITKLDKIHIPSQDEVREYAPELLEDSKGNTRGYHNYNYVLLNESTRHDLTQIVEEFISFLDSSRDSRKKKVIILPKSPNQFKTIERIIDMKKYHRDFSYFISLSEGKKGPARMYIHTGHITDGLRNIMGYGIPNLANVNID